MLAIEVKKLIKEYKNGVRALDNLNLSVKEGEIFSLLGPNGAGKSSLINILTTYFLPTSGEVSIMGKDIYKAPNSIRSQIACVAQHNSVDLHLTLEENMMFQGKLYRVSSLQARKRMKTLIENFNLERYQKYPVVSYSGGVKRRLDIAMNLMSNPKVLFLDEPTAGMDIQSRKAMWNMIRNIREDFGTTIFLTTHYLEEADELSDSICIMKDGHEVVQATPKELRQYMRQEAIRIGIDNEEQAKNCVLKFKSDFIFNAVEVKDNFIIIRTSDCREKFFSINEWLLKEGIVFRAIEIIEPSLEDVFLNFTEFHEKGSENL